MHPGPGKHEYLLGDALLVGVMTDEQPRREIVFPDGEWLDYWNNRIMYPGGTTATVEVPEDRSPVFVRLGSIIPLDVVNGAAKHGSPSSKGWRTLDVYPGTKSSKTVVWDTKQYPPSVFRDRSFISMNPLESGLEIRLEAGPTQDTILRVLRSQSPTAVTLDQKPLEKFATVTAWENAKRGWWYDADDERLWIRIAGTRDAVVTVEK